jgi:hypothetical protein
METQQSESTNAETPQDNLSVGSSATGNLSTITPNSTPDSQLQRIGKQVIDILDQLPEYVGSFVNQNKQALLSVVFILSALITVRILTAVLAAVNSIPLLAPIFELIGLFYAGWFSFRYLLKSETRQELSQKASAFKQQLLG